MDPVAPAIVLCSKLNMTSVCKCNSHSVFVGLPLFILILHPKIEFFICCSVYTLNLMLFPSLSCFCFFFGAAFWKQRDSFLSYIRPFIPSLRCVFHPPPLSTEEGESVLICLLSNVWVGDAFKLLTVITYTHACAHTGTHTHTQNDRCLMCLYVGMLRARCVFIGPDQCVCTVRGGSMTKPAGAE